MATLSDFNKGDTTPRTTTTTSFAANNNNSQPPNSSDEKETEPELLVPNKNNGLDMENYTWGQSPEEVTINVSVPKGTKRSIVCQVKKTHIKVALKGRKQAILEGELSCPVKIEHSFWSLEDNSNVSILLTKEDRMNWWKSLLEGGPVIDTQKVDPKMMFDQRQKEMRLPFTKEIEEQSVLKWLMEQYPPMVKPVGKIMGKKGIAIPVIWVSL